MSIYLEHVDGTMRKSFKNVFENCESYCNAWDELTTEDSIDLQKAVEDTLENDTDGNKVVYDYEKGYQLLKDDYLSSF